MTGHLRDVAGEVHAGAEAVLAFWFDELSQEQHWIKDVDLDRTIGERFGALRQAVVETHAAGWRDTPDTLLAAIILTDQFSRNIHRGTARAFEADALALELARAGIAHGWHETLPPDRAAFLLMPLMHAEDADAQAECVARFEVLGLDQQVKFARDHAAVIERYGRFPHRNAQLGRASTAEELAYLSQPDAGW